MDGVPYAIAQASDHTSRLVLLALCKQNTLTAKKAMEVLNVIKARDKRPAAVKPKIGGEVPLLCAACGVFYFEEDNYDTACQFHDGELEEAEDAYPDTDWFHIEGRNEDELREEFPGEYIWTCCDKRGSEDSTLGSKVRLREGCVIRRHMTEEQLANGGSISISSDSSISSGSSSNSDSSGDDGRSSNNNKRPATAEDAGDSSKKLRST